MRVLKVSECQNLLAKITLAIYVVIESCLSINLKLIKFEKLDMQEEIEFKDFKPMVLSLFGLHLYELSSIDIDSILRKVHRELIVVTADTKPAKDQACK